MNKTFHVYCLFQLFFSIGLYAEDGSLSGLGDSSLISPGTREMLDQLVGDQKAIEAFPSALKQESYVDADSVSSGMWGSAEDGLYSDPKFKVPSNPFWKSASTSLYEFSLPDSQAPTRGVIQESLWDPRNFTVAPVLMEGVREEALVKSRYDSIYLWDENIEPVEVSGDSMSFGWSIRPDLGTSQTRGRKNGKRDREIAREEEKKEREQEANR